MPHDIITCRKCGERKPRYRADCGRQCRECRLAYMQAQNAKNRHGAGGDKLRAGAREYMREWRKQNREHYRAERRKEWRRVAANPALKAEHNLRGAIQKILARNGGGKSARTAAIIGYPPKMLGEWAARNGYSPPDTHIDHIIPVAYFLRRYPDDIKRALRCAWQLSNLRVITAAENLRKGAAREFLI